MKWEDWRPVYLEIVDMLDLDSSKDRAATELLTRILRDTAPFPLLEDLQHRISGRDIVVCGAGPSLETHLESLSKRKEQKNLVYAAADGAVSALLNQGLECSIITTDLDGNLDDINEAKDRGATVIVHAHGDNMTKVKHAISVLGDVLGSTQVEPTDRAFLWGGFTDGDRACHLVADYSPQHIILAGMDFGSLVGKWSKPMHTSHFQASERKRIKLRIAKRLISSLMERSEIPFTILGN
jgi:uncharacterized Rossmann fold enzyme